MPPVNQLSAMINDGLLTNQTPAFLWVSTDAGKLEDSLRQAAIEIVEGSGPRCCGTAACFRYAAQTC